MRIYLIILVGLLFNNCTGSPDQKEKTRPESISLQRADLPDSIKTAQLSGKNLAHIYCSTCHALPDPGLLNKNTWQKKVLPQMGLRLGLPAAHLNPFLNKSTEEVYALLQAGIFPQQPLLPPKDWQKIVDYYVEQAPVALASPPLKEVKLNTNQFSVLIPALNKGKKALTTLIKFEAAAKELWVGDARNWLFRLNQNLSVLDSIQTDTPPVDIISGSEPYKIVTVGSIIPNDKGLGKVYQTSFNTETNSVSVLFNNLQRPVHIAEADLNQDKLPDLVVCHFGYNLGSLVWYRNLGKGKYEPNILKNLPGARKAEIVDLNHDGKPDIVALFSQGTETIKAFYNQGAGRFREKNLIQFPPVYGTNYFELVDFNQDGHLDLLLANGDNADYFFILKPYHGIRLWLNDGKNNFREKYFYYLPGAWKVITRDFDQDGDLDMAAISYFPDFSRTPESSFVYLEQTGKLNFSASTFPESQSGRWFTMEAADYDQDGDEDIILGSFTHALTPVPPAIQQKWETSSPSILVLQNKEITVNISRTKNIQ
jgi:hypothetical protein